MKKSISQDLESLAELVDQHHRDMGLDPEKALKQTQSLVRTIGHVFHGDTLYISVNTKDDRNQRVKELLSKGLSVRTVAKRTGLAKSTVSRIKHQ